MKTLHGRYIGVDGSMGYRQGHYYVLETDVVDGKIYIVPVKVKDHDPIPNIYNNMFAFLDSWEIKNYEGWHEKTNKNKEADRVG